MTTDEISAYSNVVLAISAACATLVAFAWKRQLRNRENYDLAKIIIMLVYNLRDGFNLVRNPFLEYVEPPVNGRSLTDKEVWNAKVKAYEARFVEFRKRRSELEAKLTEAEALWNDNVRDEFSGIIKMWAELYVAIQSHFMDIDPDRRYSKNDTTPEELNKRHSMMYDTLAEDEEFRVKLNSEIKKIRNYLKPYFAV